MAPPRVDETPKTETKDVVEVEVDVVSKVDDTATPVQVDTETPPVTGDTSHDNMYTQHTDSYLFIFVSLQLFYKCLVINLYILNFTPVICSV